MLVHLMLVISECCGISRPSQKVAEVFISEVFN